MSFFVYTLVKIISKSTNLSILQVQSFKKLVDSEIRVNIFFTSFIILIKFVTIKAQPVDFHFSNKCHNLINVTT